MTDSYQFLQIVREDGVETVTLNRPEVRNAFNDEMIAELTLWARSKHEDTPRAVVLSGAGKVFCAGADLAWMSRMIAYTREENLRDAAALAAMFETIDALPCPVVGRIHGAALGGGSGLAAVCDIVVASDETVFGFTEVKLGILPAVISPYVVAKIGLSAARELFLTGARFSASRALEIGLAHQVVARDSLDEAIAEYLCELSSSSPSGMAAVKQLLRTIHGKPGSAAAAHTTEAIAAQRVSPEGQDGMSAFLDKRDPAWNRRRPDPA